jgi:hypothetical protein
MGTYFLILAKEGNKRKGETVAAIALPPRKTKLLVYVGRQVLYSYTIQDG